MPSRCGHWALLGVMGALENQMWQTSGVIKPPESAMHTSHFQLGLIAALAVGLGFSLASTDAVGYPASAVSYGESPVVSMGGSTTHGSTTTLFSADGQDIVVTDLTLTSYSGSWCNRIHHTRLYLESGATVGEFQTNSFGANYHSSGGYASVTASTVHQNYTSGIRIQAGDQLKMEVIETGTWGYTDCSTSTASSYGVRYAASGYYAQP
jgi:hypothetical protein